MVRKWIKNELRKNPLELIVVNSINYFNNNKNSVFLGVVMVVMMCLFAGTAIRNKIKETREASKILAIALNNFERFNYSETIKNLNIIETKFNATKVMPQALYYKGISLYKLGNFEESKNVLSRCVNEFKKNNIVNEASLALASVYEQMGKFEEAIDVYDNIGDNVYLRAEAMSGTARLYELTNKTNEAIDVYTKIQSHYVNTLWGDFAKERLSHLGIKSQDVKNADIKLGLE